MKENLAVEMKTDAEPTTSVASGPETGLSDAPNRTVTFRAFLVGLIFTIGIAWMNCFFATKYNVHSIGGIQMPLGSIFILLFMVLIINVVLRFIGGSRTTGFLRPFSPTELLTVYSMSIFGALVSTPGTDNQFMVMGPALFYLATPENGWSQLFNKYVPSWFSPGWNGGANWSTHDKAVIDPVYLGGVQFKDIPWNSWAPMITGWIIFLGFVYALMFFTALLFRKQWTQREALAFPLVEVPVQMATGDDLDQAPPTKAFWGNTAVWAGIGLAIFIHFFKGMNAMFPDFPIFPVNQHGGVSIVFSEAPWNAIPRVDAKVYLGGIGLAYLLTREVAFSFWFFFLAMMFSYGFAAILGFAPGSLQTAGITGKPEFIIYQSTGAWIMMAAVLVWTGRESLGYMWKQAFGANQVDADEPYSPRFAVFGFILSFIGLMGWSWFAGINLLMALTFFAFFWVTSLVLTRTVIEGGFMFPQPPFYVLQTMSRAIYGPALDAASLTKLSFMQPMMLLDMRTNVMPAFLHTMKFAEVLRLDRKNLRRLLNATLVALACAIVVMFVTTLHVLYDQGGLLGYTWFSKGAAEATFSDAATTIKTHPGVSAANIGWMVLGAFVVFILVTGRSRFLWFPFHPLGYLVAPTYPITQLWFSFFLGWLIKTLVMKYGGSDTYVKLRPFMIGLIIGNAASMLFWAMLTFWQNGSPVSYWPA
jgi:hypothetical protein